MVTIPTVATVRLFSAGGRWCVGLGMGREIGNAAELTKPGAVSAMLTHDLGTSWPDTRGEALLGAVLEQTDGAALMVFHTLGDALACRGRIRKLRGE